MKRRAAILTLSCVALSAWLPSCRSLSDEGLDAYRYRLIFEIDTPAGLRSGSSVIEVVKPLRPGSYVRGQAVAVGLPGGQTVFVLLRSEMMADWADKAPLPAFPSIARTGDEKRDALARIEAARKSGRMPLPRRWELTGPKDTMDHTPYFVRFAAQDPRTIERVDPDDLGAAFGSGVRLKGLFVEITDDEVTTGLEKRLKWLRDRPGMIVPVSVAEQRTLIKRLGHSPLYLKITGGDFSQGIEL